MTDEPHGGVVIEKTTVVHVNKAPGYDIYIGRSNPRSGLVGSRWANPFKVGLNGTRSQVIEQYRRWLTTERPDLMAALPDLRGKILACWCAPLKCHGDVLAALADGEALQ